VRHIEIIAKLPHCDPRAAYSTLCDFGRYPENSKEVRSVTVEKRSDGQTISTWEVDFRGGILRWVEEDSFDPDKYALGFVQTEGDIEHFSGEWRIQEDGDGCLVSFNAQFDMGMPSLSKIIDPIAEQALRENITSIIRGLFGAEVEFC
jgi:ribosome-associated toxin RatA of RatAB toxin-antitoxin module